MKRTNFVRVFLSTSARFASGTVVLAASSALFAFAASTGCSSDSLKRSFGATGPTPNASTAPVASVAPAPSSIGATPALVSGVDYTEASAAAGTPAGSPVGTTYYRGGVAGSVGSAPTSSGASFGGASNSFSAVAATDAPFSPSSSSQFSSSSSTAPSSPSYSSASLAPSSQLSSSANFQEETRLREELVAARADVKRQIDANESLLRQSATYRRDAEEAVAELRRENTELSEKNRVLLASASELQADRAQNERRLQIQNAALRKAPTTVVVPNNSAATLELKLSDPKILPIRRDGDAATIELQDDLLFEPDSNRFSAEGEKRLRVLATEILNRYPTNVLSIQGHADADPTGAVDPLSVQAASVQKAYLVAEFLVEETGVARNQTIVGGCGDVRPIVSNETETNRRRNRRVEITILPETVTPRFDSSKTVSF